MKHTTQVVIVAAWLGSRMWDYTKDKPKCMLWLQDGVTIIQRNISTLIKCGIAVENIVVVWGYCYDILAQYLQSLFPWIQCVCNSRYAETNMVYSLSCAFDYLDPHRNTLLVYGDILYEEDIIQGIVKHTWIYIAADTDWHDMWMYKYGTIQDDIEEFIVSAGIVTHIGGQTNDPLQQQVRYIGIIWISADFIQHYIQEIQDMFLKTPSSINMHMTDFLQYLIDRSHTLHVYATSSRWWEFDTQRDYELFREDYNTYEWTLFPRFS